MVLSAWLAATGMEHGTGAERRVCACGRVLSLAGQPQGAFNTIPKDRAPPLQCWGPLPRAAVPAPPRPALRHAVAA